MAMPSAAAARLVLPGRSLASALLLVLALFGGASAANGKSGFTVRDFARIDATDLGIPMPLESSHELALAVVVLDGSGWQRDEVLEGIAGMAALLGQCGIHLAGLELAVVAVPPDYLDLFTPRSRELAGALQAPRPTLYFVRDTRQKPAFDAEAIGRGNSRSRPEMADSVWVTRAAPDLPVVLAHELVHVLANSGAHVDLPGNLMRDRSDPRHTRLTDAQCATLLEVGSRHGLLAPLAAD